MYIHTFKSAEGTSRLYFCFFLYREQLLHSDHQQSVIQLSESVPKTGALVGSSVWSDFIKSVLKKLMLVLI